MLLFKLTPEESSKDPIYFVLARRQKWDDMGYKRAPSVVTARVIVAALGCLMIGALTYAFVGDGSPFHMEVFTPCMITLLIDVNIHIVVFSGWHGIQRAPSVVTARVIVAALGCLMIGALTYAFVGDGSPFHMEVFMPIGVCAYILRELFCLSPEQPIYLILFSKSNRQVQI
ncbi:hypothetical protein Tco_0105737 [Tanacetum coccineum]